MSSAIVSEIACAHVKQDGAPVSEKEAAQLAWKAFESWSPALSNFPNHVRKEIARGHKPTYAKVNRTKTGYHTMWKMVARTDKML